jgi:thymidylate synthase (FAD)
MISVIDQSYEEIRETNKLKLIELVGRTCYKSEDKITDESHIKFVEGMIKSGHTAMLEHAVFTFKTNIPSVASLMSLSNFAHVTVQEVDNDWRYFVSINLTALRQLVQYMTSIWHIEAMKGYGVDTKNLYANTVAPIDYALVALMCDCVTEQYPVLLADLNVEKQGWFKFRDNLYDKYKITLINELPKGVSLHDYLTHTHKTIKFTTNRGVSHELVRHRPISIAQESTRYVNYMTGVKVIDPTPGIRLDTATEDFDEKQLEKAYVTWLEAIEASVEAYQALVTQGLAKNMARSVLPNSLKTEIVMTANMYEWLHIFSLRCASTAHPEMRIAMIPVMLDLMDGIMEWEDFRNELDVKSSLPDERLRDELKKVCNLYEMHCTEK